MSLDAANMSVRATVTIASISPAWVSWSGAFETTERVC
jgi:hypothetical protein